jgi:hypothetical protein
MRKGEREGEALDQITLFFFFIKKKKVSIDAIFVLSSGTEELLRSQL